MNTLNKSLLLLSAVLLFASCRCRQQTLTQYEPVYIHSSDSVKTEIIERVRIDTIEIEVPLPMQTVSKMVKDSLSYLETDLAESTAWVDPDGTLFHSLKNKEGSIKKDAYVPSVEKERKETETIYRDIPVKVPFAVEVEKELTAWQKFRMGAFWYLFGAFSLSILWIFRKKVFSWF